MTLAARLAKNRAGGGVGVGVGNSEVAGACLAEETLFGLVRGELSPGDEARVDAHVDDCEVCRQLVAHLAATSLVVPARGEHEAAAREAATHHEHGGEARALHGGPGDGAAPDLHAALARGTEVDRYIVLHRLGAGGMGVVYAAYDPELDRKVALKLVRLDQARHAARGDEARTRLLREAQAMARVDHANVIGVHDVGTFRGQVFVAMELVDGWTLGGWLRAEPRTQQAIVEVLLAAGRGLAAAHAAGLVHRDFKPDNVLVGRDGRVRVSDFGLARGGDAAEMPSSLQPLRRSPSAQRTVSEVGLVVGTPAYMAPEQHRGEAPDPRSDQWSWAVTAFEALLGERPFRGADMLELVQAIAAGARVTPTGWASLPAPLRSTLERALSVDPAARFAAMSEALAALAPRRTRLRGALVAAAVLAVAVSAAGLAFAGVGRAPPPCAGFEARLGGVWDEPRRAEVQAAFAATGKPFAADAWRGAASALDARTASWVHERTEACAATRVRGEQSEALLDRRMHCLDRRLAETGALVDVFARADAEVVQRAVAAIGKLAPLDDCRDTERLLSGLEPPPPERRDEVARLEAEMARLMGVARAGRPAEALAGADALLAQALATGYRPLEAAAHLLRSQMLDSAGEPVLAEAAAREAVRAGMASRHDRVVAEALVDLVRIVGFLEARHQEGMALSLDAAAALQRLPDAAYLDAQLDLHAGLVLDERGQADEAVARMQRAVAKFERLLPPDDVDLARILDGAALARFARGELLEAGALHERARAIRVEVLGPAHPDVAESAANLAGVAWGEGRLDDALQGFQQALAVFEAALGPDNIPTVQARMNVGVVLGDLERGEEALPYLERAIDSLTRSVGPEHPSVARAIYNRGAVERRLGRVSDATRDLERAEAMFRKAFGDDHIDVAMVLYERGELLRAQARYPAARALLLDSLALVGRTMGEDFRGAGMVLAALGEVDLADHRPLPALPRLERALELQLQDRIDPVTVASTRFALARARLAAGRDAPTAVADARTAAEAFRTAGARATKQLAAVERWLASPRTRAAAP